ncbi:hypothetical protein I553_6661 [Mycobacterium xenopi 4042]|uniref:Uncharacterized protein n=1 Tax=Mycobacterium xenopi 4042 TaxID=1299334 RepID=X7ZZR1_MYCXE|nr:hypothetical protein I553_6661 [Mycobacterium xenopi 4042]
MSTSPPITSGRQIADVGALDNDHPWIGPQRPRQLSIADVDGDYFPRFPIQQDFGEPAG